MTGGITEQLCYLEYWCRPIALSEYRHVDRGFTIDVGDC